MVKFYPSISSDLADWMLTQPLFFVASAPLAGDHVNVSPKGHPARSFAILNPNLAAYVDATGSGCETVSHVYENGRVTVMFNSFGSSPRILRLFCRGRVIERDDKEFEPFLKRMGKEMGLKSQRAIIVLDVFKVQTSCGYGVPLLGGTEESGEEEKTLESSGAFQDRDTMDKWASNMLEKRALPGYQKLNNAVSLDGLPGLKSARRARGEWMVLTYSKARLRRLGRQWDALVWGIFIAMVTLLLLKCMGVLVVEFRA